MEHTKQKTFLKGKTMTKLTNIELTLATPSQANDLAAELEDSLLGPVDFTTVRLQVAQTLNATPRDLIRGLEQSGYTIADWHSFRSNPWTISEILENLE